MGKQRKVSDAAVGAREYSLHRWRDLIEEQASSGMTQATFCEGRGLSLHTFRERKYRKLGRRSRATEVASALVPAFVPVEVVHEAVVVSPKPAPAPGGVEVVTDRHRVRVDVGFDAATLRRVVRILEANDC